MKIALLTDGIWPFVIGGMQKHSFYMCKFLAQHKIEVELYHTAPADVPVDLNQCFSAEELKYIRPHYVPFPKNDPFPGHYLRSSYQYSKILYELVSANGPVDLIYAKGLTSWCLLKNRYLEAPVCINVHGYEYYQKAADLFSKLQQLILRPAFRFINKHADYIYSYGVNISQLIRDRISKRQGKIIEIPGGIEKEWLTENVSRGDKIKFVFSGRYERRKGIDELFRAIQNVEKTASFEFHFIGEIPEHKKIESPSVIYHGILRSREKMQLILANADVMVCPSYSEGMPNVILEAMACGCAVIATEVGAIPDQVKADNGWIIEPGSVTAIEEAMQQAIDLSKEALNNKKQRSAEYIRENFLWEDIAGKLVESFRSIVQSGKKKTSRIVSSK